MKREISAGCVIYRIAGGNVMVVLIRPKDRDAWALPKGLVEQGEAPEAAAERESREETGLSGRIIEKIDTIKYTYAAKWENPPQRVFKIVTFFLMQCTSGDAGDHDREVEAVEWRPIEDAIAEARYSTEKQILRKARSLLQKLHSDVNSKPGKPADNEKRS